MPLQSGDVCVVFGGLGRQGASVAKHLLKEVPGVKLQLVTRKLGDDKLAQAKKDVGDSSDISVVQGDMANKEDCDRLLKGAKGCFLVTSFWPSAVDGGRECSAPMDVNFEKKCLTNVVTACVEQKVGHLVYSYLEDTSKTAEFVDMATAQGFKPPAGQEPYIVPHFDVKGEIANWLNDPSNLKDSGLLVDLVPVAFYYENYFGMKPTKQEDGSYAMYLPLGGKPHFAVVSGDVGKTAAPLFKRAPVYGDQMLPGTKDQKSWPITGCVGSMLTGDEIAAAFSEVCLKGAKVVCVDVPVAGWIEAGIKNGFPEVVATDFGQMFGYYQTAVAQELRKKAFEENMSRGDMTEFKAWLEMVKAMLYPEVWA